MFVCLSELIEELVRATDLNFGMRVEYVLPRNKGDKLTKCFDLLELRVY